jgi:hypothetical protein
MTSTTLPNRFSRHWKLKALAATFFSTLLLCSAHAGIRRFPEAQLMRGRTAGGYPYISGGISFDEQRAIETLGHLYNLKLVFARPAGTLTAPVFLIIGFNKARHVEKISVRAPWFYIRLPAGGYTLLARFKRDVVLVRDVYVEEGGHRTYFLRGQ